MTGAGKKWIVFASWCFLVVVLLLFPWPDPIARANPFSKYSHVEFYEGRASFHAKGIKLSYLLEELAQQAGIMIVLDPEADRIRTLDLQDIPLEVSLKHLLVGISYAGVWQKQARQGEPGRVVLKKLFVYPKGKSGPGRDSLVFGSSNKRGAGGRHKITGKNDSSGSNDELAAYLGRKPGQTHWREKQEMMGLDLKGKKIGDIGIDWEMETYVNRKKKIGIKFKSY